LAILGFGTQTRRDIADRTNRRVARTLGKPDLPQRRISLCDAGFGFVTLDDGSGDAFLHVSVVERHGGAGVPPGATLEVRSGPGPKGPQVTEIISVDISTAAQEQPRRPRPERPAYQPSPDRTTVEETGSVKWYNATKGFGFIAADRGGKDIFVHATALERAGILGLAEGQRVAVDVADGQKGPEAVSLRAI
jgi:CspA family cold shock protein